MFNINASLSLFSLSSENSEGRKCTSFHVSLQAESVPLAFEGRCPLQRSLLPIEILSESWIQVGGVKERTWEKRAFDDWIFQIRDSVMGKEADCNRARDRPIDRIE